MKNLLCVCFVFVLNLSLSYAQSEKRVTQNYEGSNKVCTEITKSDSEKTINCYSKKGILICTHSVPASHNILTTFHKNGSVKKVEIRDAKGSISVFEYTRAGQLIQKK